MRFKRFKYAALAAALVTTAIAPVAAAEASTTWKKSGSRWWVDNGDGTYASAEWVGGYWIRKNGYWDGVTTKAKWGYDHIGWWYGYKGWYAQSQWQKIDGEWYYFDKEYHAVTDCYVRGNYLDADGVYQEKKSGYHWNKVKTGSSKGKWWYGKNSKNYVADGWVKIDGEWYYFDEEGILQTWKLLDIDGTVYGFDSNGHAKEYTVVTPADEISGEITFEVTEDNYKDAAMDMEDFLVLATNVGAKKVMTVGDEDKVIEHVVLPDESEHILVDGEDLVDYVERVGAGSVTVKGTGSTEKLFEALRLSNITESTSYNYSVVIGDAKFTKFRFNASANAMYFTADKVNYQSIVDLDTNVVYILTDVTDSAMFKALTDAGVIDENDAEVVKEEYMIVY